MLSSTFSNQSFSCATIKSKQKSSPTPQFSESSTRSPLRFSLLSWNSSKGNLFWTSLCWSAVCRASHWFMFKATLSFWSLTSRSLFVLASTFPSSTVQLAMQFQLISGEGLFAKNIYKILEIYKLNREPCWVHKSLSFSFWHVRLQTLYAVYLHLPTPLLPLQQL